MSIRLAFRRVSITAFGVIAVFVVGLGQPVGGEPQVGTGPGIAATSVATTGQVFGRLRLYQKGKEVEFSHFTNRLQLFVRSQQSGEIQRKDFTGKGGNFQWTLPSGDYVIVGYFFQNQTGRLWLTFSVPDTGEAAYIGDLHIFVLDGRYGWQILDASPDAAKDSRGGSAIEGEKTTVALMKAEERLGRYRRMTSVCAVAEWGIECDRTNQGVKPLSPAQTTSGFPIVDSLTPRLAWSPVDREGVTYDLAVYESIGAPILGLKHIRGTLLLYVEALPQPFYQFDTPLARGKRFEWSVRLRREDVVSTWSTTGYFVFFIIGAASGSGNWFEFSTPD
jgi:hypothetical protein